MGVWWELLRLRYGSSGTRSSAAFRFTESPDAGAVRALARALADKSADVRGTAARALQAASRAGVVDSRARAGVVSSLLPALRDRDSDVRQQAATALGLLRADEALGALIEALGDGDPFVRGSAATALGRLGHVEAFEPLLAALGEPNEMGVIHHHVAFALGEIGDMRAVPALADLVGDSGARGPASRRALVKLTGEDLGQDADAWRRWWEANEAAVDGSAQPQSFAGADILAELGLAVARPQHDTTAAVELASSASDEDMAPLRHLARQPRVDEKELAGVLSRLADERNVSCLLNAFLHEPFASLAAAKALGRTRGSLEVVDALLKCLVDVWEDYDIRWAAAKSLGQIGHPRAVRDLIWVLAVSSEFPRALAALRAQPARARDDLGSSSALSELHDVALDAGAVAKPAANALMSILRKSAPDVEERELAAITRLPRAFQGRIHWDQHRWRKVMQADGHDRVELAAVKAKAGEELARREAQR